MACHPVFHVFIIAYVSKIKTDDALAKYDIHVLLYSHIHIGDQTNKKLRLHRRDDSRDSRDLDMYFNQLIILRKNKTSHSMNNT